LADEAATLHFAAALAQAIQPNLTIYLHGNLGAGKTTLVRGLLHALGYVGKVKSPTYNLVEIYEISRGAEARLNIYHFDLYRFNDAEEWEEAGFRDYFNSGSVCLIEWPENAAGILPMADIDINFAIKEQGRKLSVSAHSVAGQQFLQAISIEKSHDR